MCNDDPRIENNPEWDPLEDQALQSLHDQFYHGYQWVQTASDLGTRRTAMQCFQRYRYLQAKRECDEFWTEEEDKILLDKMDLYGDWWQQVALFLPGRSPTQCGSRFLSTLEKSIRSGKWDAQEDSKLQLAVEAYGTKWARVAHHVEGRTGQKCRERYYTAHEAAASTKRGMAFSVEEDELLVQTVHDFGEGNWSKIAAHLGSRSDSQYRRRYARIIAKRDRELGAKAVSNRESNPCIVAPPVANPPGDVIIASELTLCEVNPNVLPEPRLALIADSNSDALRDSNLAVAFAVRKPGRPRKTPRVSRNRIDIATVDGESDIQPENMVQSHGSTTDIPAMANAVPATAVEPKRRGRRKQKPTEPGEVSVVEGPHVGSAVGSEEVPLSQSLGHVQVVDVVPDQSKRRGRPPKSTSSKNRRKKSGNSGSISGHVVADLRVDNSDHKETGPKQVNGPDQRDVDHEAVTNDDRAKDHAVNQAENDSTMQLYCEDAPQERNSVADKVDDEEVVNVPVEGVPILQEDVGNEKTESALNTHVHSHENSVFGNNQNKHAGVEITLANTGPEISNDSRDCHSAANVFDGDEPESQSNVQFAGGSDKLENDDSGAGELNLMSAARRRVRPRKLHPSSPLSAPNEDRAQPKPVQKPLAAPKKRGRPRKTVFISENSPAISDKRVERSRLSPSRQQGEIDVHHAQPISKRGRGRPPKKKEVDIVRDDHETTVDEGFRVVDSPRSEELNEDNPSVVTEKRSRISNVGKGGAPSKRIRSSTDSNEPRRGCSGKETTIFTNDAVEDRQSTPISPHFQS
eukprot:CRZ04598.1 hypothetical protein [Spongospora subterranea]